MKLSETILEQYKDCESMLMILNKGLATETRDVHLKVTRNLIIERERDASIITQAYKDALFMEGEIEKKEEAVILACDHEFYAHPKTKVGDSYHCTKCNSAVVVECEHRWGKTHFDNRKDKHYMICDDCGHSTL